MKHTLPLAPVRTWRDRSIELLNDLFAPLSVGERITQLYKYFKEEEVLFTSSFGTKSIFLLHQMAQFRPTQKVHFLDTTYHFPETITYKDQVSTALGLEVIDIVPDPVQNALTREEQWWEAHPRMCCSINKVAPLEPVKAQHKVWISGLMAFQTDFRSRLNIFEKQGDIVKFHPLIDLEEVAFRQTMETLDLPQHPLLACGYGSVGCTHCTAKGEGRAGRWKGSAKTECGLHPRYFVQKEQ
ncbi:MAG: phosphoadenylyl-sulfate reductase [Bacteroidota bacterium]